MFRSKNFIKAYSTKIKLASQANLNATCLRKNQQQTPNQPNFDKEATEPSSRTPTSMSDELGPVSRYLVFKYSSRKYAKIEDVPNRVSSEELNNARDKGRAKALLFGIGFTVIGCLIAGYVGKSLHNQGHRYTDELVKQHAEYSRVHQEMVKSIQK